MNRRLSSILLVLTASMAMTSCGKPPTLAEAGRESGCARLTVDPVKPAGVVAQGYCLRGEARTTVRIFTDNGARDKAVDAYVAEVKSSGLDSPSYRVSAIGHSWAAFKQPKWLYRG